MLYNRPLIKNSRHTLDIRALASDGQGIGELDGHRILVDGALPGERVALKLIKVAEDYAVGRLNDVLVPSPNRIVPFCKAFRRCGGCTLQHLDYAAQCRVKTGRLRDLLARAEWSASIPVLEMLSMPIPRRYRNKAQYPIAKVRGAVRMGLYARHSHDIIEHAECAVQPAVMTHIRDIVRHFLAERDIAIYDEGTHQGLVRYLLIRHARQTDECMVVLVVNGDGLPGRQDLIATLTEQIPNLRGILLNRNTQVTNSILGPTTEVLWGAATISDKLGDAWFDISPHSFYQINPQQAEILYQRVRQYADLHGGESVFDLYCGIGTIALSLARQAGTVYGIDSVPQAVHDAVRNAARNHVTNAEFVTGAAEQVFPDMIRRGLSADVVVLDPPRKGCDAALLSALAACRPKRIVYVSCYPKSLLRDLEILTRRGYRCIEIQPVDMFPHTMHVESVANIAPADF